MDLDDADHRILTVLQRDARASMSDVAREAHVSRATAYSRTLWRWSSISMNFSFVSAGCCQ